jgi:hypothetical protein
MRYASTLRSLYAPYLVATGVWPLAHRRSFERVTGPKQDYWLVQTVGALAIVIGTSLGVAVRRRAKEPETIVLGAASCIAFGLASVRALQTESRVYLGDALLEIAFLAAWLEPLLERARLRSADPRWTAISPREV